MSNKYNDFLIELAWDRALEQCDPSCPNEVVGELANKIFEELMLVHEPQTGYEEDGEFVEDETEETGGTKFHTNTEPTDHERELDVENKVEEVDDNDYL